MNPIKIPKDDKLKINFQTLKFLTAVKSNPNITNA
jgi:hypothetical protein